MHLVRVKVIQLLVIRMVGDDGESTRTDPDPQVFLEGFRGIKGPNSAASHFYETEASVYIIAAFRINMAEVVRKLSGVRAWKTAWRFSSIIIFQHSELITIRYS